MNEIHGLLCRHKPQVAIQKNLSMGAIAEGSESEKYTSMILCKDT